MQSPVAANQTMAVPTESGGCCPPRADFQEQDRTEDDVNAYGYVDAPFEIPAIGLQEIQSAQIRSAERGFEAELHQRGPDGTKAGKSDIYGHESGDNDAEK